MQRSVLLLACLVLHSAGLVTKTDSDDSLSKNPIRKVVNLLKKMSDKLDKEGKEEAELYDNFMCYCKNNDADLKKSIADAESRIPEVAADIDEQTAQKAATTQELAQHKADRTAAKAAIAQAVATREKENTEFLAEKKAQETDIAAITGALAAISKGTGKSFLQSNSAQLLRKLAVSKADMEDSDRDALVSFLSASSDYSPQSGEIVGILKTLKDSMEKTLAETEAGEASAVDSFNKLKDAKERELESLNQNVQEKAQRVGELSTTIAMMMRDKMETTKALNDDRDFIADLARNCAAKTTQWEERQKIRATESTAIAETIKILNDDDALDLFKKTLPGASSAASFVQVDSKTAARQVALKYVRQAQQNAADPKLDFISMALHGKKMGFDMVFEMINEMIQQLKDEQVTDDDTRHHCLVNFDKSADKKKFLTQEIADTETVNSKIEDDIAALEEQIKDEKDGIQKIDALVTKAGQQRESENKDFLAAVQENQEAVQLLKFAKNRLYKFYNPDLYIPPAGEAAASLLQVVRHKADPGEAPKTFGSYEKKSQESVGVLQLIDGLISDLKKDTTEAQAAERDAQGDYELMLHHSKDKREILSAKLSDQQGEKAGEEEDLETKKDELKSAKNDLKNTEEYVMNLHSQCDWLLANYQTRKEARSAEIDQMNLAKGALKGAIYSE